MRESLSWQTVSDTLASILKTLMAADPLAAFRLVGGTALSLQLGHRVSVDIDLFADAAYGSVDLKAITSYLRRSLPYVDTTDYAEVGFGQTYFVGQDEQRAIKLDLFYTDAFVRPALLIDGIRMAHVDDIIAMKMDVVARGGRRKDFWDLHELLDSYPVDKMIALHKERYPYNHDGAALRKQLTDFSEAENDFEPLCLRGKHWEFVKLDIINATINDRHVPGPYKYQPKQQNPANSEVLLMGARNRNAIPA